MRSISERRVRIAAAERSASSPPTFESFDWRSTAVSLPGFAAWSWRVIWLKRVTISSYLARRCASTCAKKVR